jgi:hypothetical protein
MLSGLMDMDAKPTVSALGLQTNVSAFWSLENTSWLDDTGNGNTLTQSATPPTVVTGIVGNAAKFVSASSESLSIASNSFLAVGGGNYSLQCWVKVTIVGGAWFSKSTGGFANREFSFIDIFSSGHFYGFNFYKSNAVISTLTSTVPVDTTTFHHLVATWDGTTVRFYVDAGTPVTNVPGLGSVNSTSSVLIGEDGDGNVFGDAVVDQVGIWKGRVLSATDVTNLYNGGAGLSWAAMA